MARDLNLPFPREESVVKGARMIAWVVVFLAIALVAALFGFTGLYAATSAVAQIVFFIFVVLFLVTLITAVARRPG